jgi:hypothetical protein|tara:strand:+ start:255 stop:677 length:423 start_codon:yes stop_codon:yes gene_type:complete
MAAVNLNTVRATIEKRLNDEFRIGPSIPLVFNNIPFDASTVDTFIQCLVSFGNNSYLTQASSGTGNNQITGLILCNIFTKQGVGSGENFAICKRLRDLYNRITVSSVIFDAPIGPEIFASTPEGKFQTQIRITFSIYEEL